MFGLGLLVGRGSSPVLFETRPFQEYLGRMLSELSAKLPEKGKVDLKFYDVLDEPVYYPVKGKIDDPGEITPGLEIGKIASIKPAPYNSRADDIPVKRSRKLATWNQAGQGGYGNNIAPAAPPKKSASVKTYKKAKLDTGKSPAPAHGEYTIQVASYKNLNDALTQMVLLNEKGIASYRASVKIKGKTWYRVRIGSFADYKAAKARLAKLAGAGVNGMVIKKER